MDGEPQNNIKNILNLIPGVYDKKENSVVIRRLNDNSTYIHI